MRILSDRNTEKLGFILAYSAIIPLYIAGGGLAGAAFGSAMPLEDIGIDCTKYCSNNTLAGAGVGAILGAGLGIKNTAHSAGKQYPKQ